MVSFRGDTLKLLPLRGRLVVAGKVVNEITLAPGQVIGFSPDLSVVVESVDLPETVVALAGDGLPPTVLPGAIALVLTPQPSLAPVSASNAVARLWNQGDRWRVRMDTRVFALSVGDTFEVDGHTFTLVERPLNGHQPTLRPVEEVPLQIVCRYESVHVFRRGKSPVVLDGVPAQVMSELAMFGVPVPWRSLARAIWGRQLDERRLRKRLDGGLARLRTALRHGGIREDLVRNSGRGQVELYLHPSDHVEDEA